MLLNPAASFCSRELWAKRKACDTRAARAKTQSKPHLCHRQCFNSVGKPGLAGEACSRRLETCGWNLGILYFQGWSLVPYGGKDNFLLKSSSGERLCFKEPVIARSGGWQEGWVQVSPRPRSFILPLQPFQGRCPHSSTGRILLIVLFPRGFFLTKICLVFVYFFSLAERVWRMLFK